ncbi:MAG TPA: hypothetical protein PKE01_14925 [Rhodocyclaceae bacterium]|nr:hypothetical protein [Rhodocyclaceae bacterium]HMV64622.1 hypothetical protein [Rhodocyclaceae bacterium]HMW50961.1 hypothetical protein [Rhodocyclaceae bacterium]HMY48201.1 hypothetical protein [Rhodocyclaceae bacterium]HMZ74833.1 hypothetical protein [Rhodocyclaceae bacterium]
MNFLVYLIPHYKIRLRLICSQAPIDGGEGCEVVVDGSVQVPIDECAAQRAFWDWVFALKSQLRRGARAG